MKIRLVSTLITMLLLSLTAINSHASLCPADNVVTEPDQFLWAHHPVTEKNSEEYWSGTLEMGEATFTINGEILTTRAYRQEGGAYSIPGPTIPMDPGKKYVLRFKNTLPYQPLVAEHNIFKDPNVTNVHTHGVHISGETPADDVTRFFEGGFGGDYVYEIPADHMGGTYWYHAHHHGSTFLQVSSGAFGLILISDDGDEIPTNVANMTERQLVMGFLDPNGAAGTGGDTLNSGTLPPTWTTNGKVNGNVCMPANTWQHWRMLIADQDARLVDLEIGSQCEVALMARDGVWRTQVPKAITNNLLTLTGASRADLAVRCSGDSSISVGGTQVAQIYVDGTSNTSVSPYAADGVSIWPSKRPNYLRDLRNEPIVDTESIRMGARSVLGSKFHADIPNLTKYANGAHKGVQEWSLHGATNHPFHLHIYHVQVQGDCGPYEDGEFYDVIAGGCTLRFDLDPDTSSVYDGRTILHCHILAHEDQGAMGWMDVIGGKAPPTFPVNTDIGTEYQNYYAIGGGTGNNPPIAPENLSTTVVSSSQINLSWDDASADETGFDIERSLDGVTFTRIASTGANTTNFSDTGLTASTTYHYQVLAFNSNGNSGYTNSSSATTQPQVSATSVKVGSIVVSTVGLGKGQKGGRAVVVVVDDQGATVANAFVSGAFSGDFNDTISNNGPTDGNGSTTIDTISGAKSVKSLNFCVTAITHNTLTDFTAVPGVVCGSL